MTGGEGFPVGIADAVEVAVGVHAQRGGLAVPGDDGQGRAGGVVVDGGDVAVTVGDCAFKTTGPGFF